MTRVEQTAVAFLVTPGAAQKHTFQLFNSIEKGRFRGALASLRRACACADHAGRHFTEVVRRFPPRVGFPRPEATVQMAAQFGSRGADVRRFPSAALWPAGKDPGAGANSDHRNLPRTKPAPDGDTKMRLIYRQFFNVSERINYVSEAR
jgi:hypothetical protein